ncbi:intestinal mucin-like protein [Aplochiton taeniatus]
MTKKYIDGIFTNMVYVNDKLVTLAYLSPEFKITDNGIDTMLVIPAIDATVVFTGLMFTIHLPYDKFNHNTEGQCGTCDNNRTDDCMLPSGKIVSSCPYMAQEWHVPDKNKSQCNTPPTDPPIVPTDHPCKAPVCDIISSNVFEECHKVIPYQPFIEACIYDVCHLDKEIIGCTSLQTYADLCAENGVCVSWRNATNATCDYECQSPMVYEACGPQVEPTCDASYNYKFITEDNKFTAMTDLQLEGCYCPPGTTLFRSGSNICLENCQVCPLPNGGWKKANETWISECDECICEEDTLRIFCRAVPCPTQSSVTCDLEGQVKVKETVDCCQKEKCGPLKPHHCNVTSSLVNLENNGCHSIEQIELTSCGGSCETFSLYSAEAQAMQHSCSCCQEVSTTKRQAELICADGSKVNHTYLYVEKCGCKNNECIVPELSTNTRAPLGRR